MQWRERAGAAADTHDRVLMVAENFHFMPAFRHVHALVTSGAIGPLRAIHLVARGYRQQSGWRLVSGAAGGGVLIDGGIHYVHILRWWGGEVRRLFALRPPQTVDLGGEDAVDLLAELPDGVVGFVSNSLGATGVPRVQWSSVTGADGTIFADNRGRCVLLRGRGRTRLRLFHRDSRGHEAMLRAFDDAVGSGRPPETDGVSGRCDLAVVLAAYRSVAERRPVDLSC